MGNLVEEFVKEKEKLKNYSLLLKEEGFLSDEDVQKIEELLNNDKIKIAIIGQMKAGKSTFIDSLIFKDTFLPTAATPMTAALSKIEYGNTDSYEVTFFNQEEFEEMEKVDDDTFKDSIAKAKSLGGELYRLLGTTKTIVPSEFKEYVGANGRYTPIVKMLTIKTPNEILKEAIVVDTPGFNDPVKSRDEIAFKFIDEADFIILFLSATRPFDSTDREIIVDKLSKGPMGKLLLVINKADALLEEYGTFDNVKEYVERKYKESVEDNISSSKLKELLLEAKVIPISAKMALLGRMDKSKIENDKDEKWYFDKFMDDLNLKSQEDFVRVSQIEELENSIKESIKTEKNKILINKVKGQIVTTIRKQLDKYNQEKIRLQQDLENIKNRNEIEEKKKIIEEFIDNEFDELCSTISILEKVKSEIENSTRNLKNEIKNTQKDTLSQIGTLVDKLGKDKGVKELSDFFREFNFEIKSKLKKDIEYILNIMKEELKDKIKELFTELKEHKLSTKFQFKYNDYEKMQQSIMMIQEDSITEAVNDIKLELPEIDKGFIFGIFGDSKEEIKDKFYNFSENYFAQLEKKINEIYNAFTTLAVQKVGSDNELKPQLKKKLIDPIRESLYQIEEELKQKTDLQAQKEKELEYVTANVERLENKIKDVENQLKG